MPKDLRPLVTIVVISCAITLKRLDGNTMDGRRELPQEMARNGL